MTDPRIDALCTRYLAALDADDRETMDAIWRQAETWPELEEALVRASDRYLDRRDPWLAERIAAEPEYGLCVARRIIGEYIGEGDA